MLTEQLKKALLATLLVLLLAVTLRLVNIGSFMVVDEENWFIRSSDYYHNLFRNGDTGGAFMTTHPGATTMWIAGAGIAAQEARLGFDADTSNLEYFRRAAKIPIAVVAVLLIGISTWLVIRLAGLVVGTTVGVLLAVDPYSIGMSQVVHPDALLGLFMLAGLLAYLLYFKERRLKWLLLAGVFGGWALATKLLPALWLFVMFGLIVVAVNVRQLKQKNGWRAAWAEVVRRLGLVVGVAALVFYITWPALWFTADLNNSFEKDVPSVVTQEHVAIILDDEPASPLSFYPRTMLGRLTPYAQVLVVGALVALVVRAVRRKRFSSAELTLVVLTAYAVGYLVLITFVAKKADRYALPAISAWLVVAGIVAAAGLPLLRQRLAQRTLRLTLAGLTVAVVAVALLWMPYTITYTNPLFPNVRSLTQQGWGEGLDAAAAWLNERPLGNRLTVATWYPRVLQTYFQGTTFSLSSRQDPRVGYVVTYRNMGDRSPDAVASNVLDEFKNDEPVHTVLINGVPYAWIYDVLQPAAYPKHVGELVSGMEVGQTVRPAVDGWAGVRIGFATFSSRNNIEDVVIHIRESLAATEDVRTVRINARDVVDNEWHEVLFEPITDSAGKEFYVAVTSPTSQPGNAVTVRYVDEDIDSGQRVLRREPLKSGETAADFVVTGDAAIRVP